MKNTQRSIMDAPFINENILRMIEFEYILRTLFEKMKIIPSKDVAYKTTHIHIYLST